MADLFQFVLALIAVAYSTWVVLPWAFYERLENRVMRKELNWLQLAEHFLFVSGSLLLFYVIVDLVSGTISDQLVLSLLSYMKTALLFLGIFGLFIGLFDTYRVVNACSGASEQEQKMLVYWALIPFYIAGSAGAVAYLLAFLTEYPKTSFIAGVFFVVMLLSLALGYLGIKNLPNIFELDLRHPTLRFLGAVILLLVPLLSVGFMYGLVYFRVLRFG